jgi:signal transduction histidine kinase
MVQDADRMSGQSRLGRVENLTAPFLNSMMALPLDRRFALVGGMVSIVGMAVIGAFVSSRIESAVVRNSAISAAIYMESFVAPLSQELLQRDELSVESRTRLDDMLAQPGIAERILSVKIWREDGQIAYASAPELIGRRFEPSEELRRGWTGELIAKFDQLDDVESSGERDLGRPLLEVYNPIHSIYTGEIIAVAEFYQDAGELEEDLTRAWLTSWSIVAIVAGATFVALWGIVRSAHLTIERQKRQLVQRMQDVSHVSELNQSLRASIQQASEKTTALNEQFLRRIGADLHDGPAQALAFANLRISAWRAHGAPDEAKQILAALEDALDEIRNLARGLVLPDLEGKSITYAICRAAEAHSSRTETEVTLVASAVDAQPSLPQLICVYRFVQEGLSNAWKHAEGTGQCVEWSITNGLLEATIRDEGPGFDVIAAERSGRIGLEAMRQRVQSVGGSFVVESQAGGGTCLKLTLKLNEARQGP